jgi:8-oxo-dGTP diphosphatase
MSEVDPSAPRAVRRGVVAVVIRDARFLMIRRSASVVAPGALCFAGGGIESGETESDAVVREFREELGVELNPLHRVWTSTTRWQVELAWWLGDLQASSVLSPNPLEVASVHWFHADEALIVPELLASNRAFFEALARQEIALSI